MYSYKGGYTALMWAAIYGHVEVVRLLIEAGASLNIQDSVSTLVGFVFTHIPRNFDIVLYYQS
jgi:hypothetical protein